VHVVAPVETNTGDDEPQAQSLSPQVTAELHIDNCSLQMQLTGFV